MEIEELASRVIARQMPAPADILALTSADASRFVLHLKSEVERHWRIDPDISLFCTQAIIDTGHTLGDRSVVALGTMARGDSLRYIHQNDPAWQMLDDAGQLYRELGDEVGWARTRIGRLAICVEMNAVDTALKDAAEARTIFHNHQESDKLIRLETNFAAVYNYRAEFPLAIEKCHEVLRLTELVGNTDNNMKIVAYFNLGYAHQGLGNLREALDWYTRTREIMVARGETVGVAQVNLSIVNIEQARGHHKAALQLLHQIIDVVQSHQSLEASREMWHLIECYFYLNRFNDARDLVRKVIEKYPADHETYELGQSLLQLAVADAALGDFSQVFETLQRAETILQRLNAMAWMGTIHLYRGQAALHLGDLSTVRRSAGEAAGHFREQGRQDAYLTAVMLAANGELAGGNIDTAYEMTRDIQKLSRQLRIPHLSYKAHLLLGKIAEQNGKTGRAVRHYQAATVVMERVKRSLVLTSRVDFLEDKQEALHALLRLYIASGRTETAFDALERAKAQVWLGYLGQFDHLRWVREESGMQPLIDELNHLREAHHWYYRAAYDPVFREQQHVAISPEAAAFEASARERRLRVLTEQLYLRSSMDDLAVTGTVSVAAIQSHLSDDTALIEYYSDGHHFHAFVMDNRQLRVFSLPEPVATVEKLLDKWQSNINRALRTAPGSGAEKMLHGYGRQIARDLHSALIQPFAQHIQRYQRLTIVPYSILHYLPFHLLHDGSGYLIEQAEVVILPAASLIQRSIPRQERRARALAYDWDGRLQHSLEEAQRVAARFGGRAYGEGDACQSVLDAPPCQILHISAHGQYRIDRPDFSYIQLADGPLYTDDLFQHDLRYELVTLSACETGRSRAAAGDELIGLGRGFLFAGAGALIASLWRVNETMTLELMDELYQQLDRGASKAAALRAAQLALIRACPDLHPAFWGAFELIGNPDSLSRII